MGGRRETSLLAMEHVPSADCRICLEGPSDGRPLIVPCECAGTCKWVHRDCLEHWVLEKRSANCEVCKAPYKDEALTELGKHRIEEQRRRELEWPQHDSDFFDEAAMLARPAYVVQATRRMFFLSTISLLAVFFFLAQEDDGSPYAYSSNGRSPHDGLADDDISDAQATSYLAELGLRGARMGAAPAPPWSALPAAAGVFSFYAGGSDGAGAGIEGASAGLLPPAAVHLAGSAALLAAPPSAQPEAAPSYDDRDAAPLGRSWGGGGDGGDGGGDGGGGLWLSHGLGFGDSDAPSPPLPPAAVLPMSPAPPTTAATEDALQELIDASGCESEEGRASSERTCMLAEKVLRHIRLDRELMREQYAEQEAGEAMGRLTRAFVLLCILRIVLAQQQRRRLLIERQLVWDRRGVAALPV